jgi:NAD-dependent dihydropyrimidine dehydrogenase PreA subunit
MNAARPSDLIRELLQTALRLFPWPTEPGLRKVGNPGPESPVLVTGNYDLTVRRLLRALAGRDAWVLVAPSSGINVWCAAAGGHLSTHHVVTALRTSGIEEQVRHRRAVLPQLAATGVVAREVARRTGWKVRFGPVRAEDIPAWLDAGGKKTDAMRRVNFGVRERLEMATAWAAPAVALLAPLAAWLTDGWALPLAAWIVTLALFVFFAFDRLPEPRRLITATGAVAVSLVAASLSHAGTATLVGAPLASIALVALLTFDYSGSTPIEGGSHFAERNWHVELDPERCRGVYNCREVCPEGCFALPTEDPHGVVLMPHAERCIRCGACIVQCPMDALALVDEAGTRIEPDVLRRYKLNLLGQRTALSPDDPA